MKKLISLIVFIFGTLSFTLASQPTVGTDMTRQDLHSTTSFRSSGACIDNGSTVYETYHFYVGDSFSMFDAHAGAQSHYAFIYDTASKVIVNDPYYVFHFNNNFKWKSNGKPVGVNAVKFVLYSGYFKTGTLLTNLPNVSGGALVGQVVFNLQRKWYNNEYNGNGSGTINYYPYPSGPQSTTGFSHYYVGNTMSGYECFNYIVHYCGDGVRDTQASMAALPNGKSNSVANEQCDSGPNNGQPGYCNSACTGTIPVVEQPVCSGSINGHTQYTPNGNNWLNQNMGLCVNGTVINFTYSWNTGHSRHFNWDCTNGTQTITGCYAYQNWCGNGRVDEGHNESCDDGLLNGTPGYCNSACTGTIPVVEQPVCSGSINGHTQYTPNGNNWLNQNMGLCVNGTVINFTYSWNTGHSRHFNWDCTNGTQTITGCYAYQNWCGNGRVDEGHNESCDDGLLNGTPGYCNSACTGQVPLPGQPNLTIVKEKIGTGTMEAGDTVVYKITARNTGSGTATGVSIYDLLPRELQYMTSSITVPSYSSYLFTQGTIGGGGNQRTYIRYYNITLNANGTAIVYLTGKVKTGYVFDELTNCAIISGFNIPEKTGCITVTPPTPPAPPAPYFLKEQRVGSTSFTTSDITVNTGDTIRYKLTFGNNGNVAATGELRDFIPQCLQYMTSSIAGVSPYNVSLPTQWNNYKLRYYNFTLQPGQTGHVIIQARVKSDGPCANITTYINTGYFTLGGITISGDVVAKRPIPYVKKWQSLYDVDNYVDTLLQVELGDFIKYRVDFGNSGSVGATGEVKDLLPRCVEYVSGSLNLVNGTGPTTGYENSNMYVQYSDIYLEPGQNGYMLVLGKIKTGGDCLEVSHYVNTGMFHFTRRPWLTSKVEAVRPDTLVTILKEVDKPVVHSGDYVTYTITYTNHGPDMLTSYTIVDTWPSDKIRFIDSSSEWQRYDFAHVGNTLTWYYNGQEFRSGDVRTIIVTGQVLGNR